VPEKENQNANNLAMAATGSGINEGVEAKIKTKDGLTVKEVSGTGKRGDVTIDIVVNYCKGCEICVVFCPEKVLVMNREIVEVLDISKCSKCNICEYLCPDFSISVE